MLLAKHDVAERFAQHFGGTPRWIVRAPGRVNLIGEHTDYNDGFVLPMAIDRAIWIALRPRDDQTVVVHAIDLQQQGTFSLERLANEKAGWIEYVKAVAWSLQQDGCQLAGWEGVLLGDVPMDAGLSSSAALEMASARAFAATAQLDWEPVSMAKVGLRAERQWIGLNCGIMDQLISAVGVADHAVLIDCRSLETTPVPIPPEVAVVILDTATRRGLVDSAYNQRRAECESAADFFQVPSLRDVGPELFERLASELDEPARRRALHVITENDRTLQAAEAMCRGEVSALGVLMNKSHASLRDDYEVSSDALNAMVETARTHDACHGARMTGAGFGGCAVAVIDARAANEFVRTTAAAYEQKTGHTPAIYICQATNGSEIVEPARET